MRSPAQIGEKTVKIGNKIAIRLENGAELTLRIAYTYKQDPGETTISWLSPLGKAVLGKKSGDTTVYKVGDNTKRVYIEKIIEES